LLADLAHWGLFGALSVQLYLYYQAFPNDKLPTKCVVYSVYTIGLAQTILQTHDAFATYGSGFGDISEFTDIHLEWLDVPILGGLVAFIGQMFYAYRVYVLSGFWFVPVLIVVVSLASSLGAILTGAFTLAGMIFLLAVYSGLVWCGASALCDIIIAVSMTSYLFTQASGFRQARALVLKVIRLTLETGSLTAVVAVANLIVFLAFPGQPYFIIPTGLMSRLYANCILVVLNARCQIVGGRGTDGPPMDTLSTPSFLRDLGTRAASSNAAPTFTINREAVSDEASHDRVEMKTLGVRSVSL
ncbi:hypothetical protein FB451DRAFT_1040199, partial [Mycena latifolia]